MRLFPDILIVIVGAVLLVVLIRPSQLWLCVTLGMAWGLLVAAFGFYRRGRRNV